MSYDDSAQDSFGEASQDHSLAPLTQVFHAQLMACLEECAAGRRGLFSDYETAGSVVSDTGWPEAARLRELAFALQAILAQSGESDMLCEQFLDLCSIHGENDPGEPRLARAFLNQIASGQIASGEQA
jgi:hypothetical protein